MKTDTAPLIAPQDGTWQPSAGDKRRRWKFVFVTVALLSWLVFLHHRFNERWIPFRDPQPEDSRANKPFDWSEIEAKKQLEFHPCFGDFECAKLELPLDYFNGTHPEKTVSVALAKLPARVSVDDPRYGGPMLINPGGPGGSGVLLALIEAAALQTIVDAPGDPLPLEGSQDEIKTSAKYFDVIGFDPRGIGFTEPAASCMTDQASWWSWRLREATEGILGSSDAALGRLWSMTHSYGESCRLNLDKDEPDIKQYMSTASVARDMLEIAARHAEYVSNKIANNGKTPKCKNTEVTTYAPGKTKLHYWGFSYGTLLGATFASMYPGNVGRLVLDGVVNSDDYMNSLGGGSLHDTEKVMTSFYTYCIRAGPTACPLSAAASSIEDVEYRVQNIVNSLYHNPIQVSSEDGPEVFEYSDIRLLIFSSLYSPAFTFPIVANILLAVENGTDSPMLSQLARAYRYAHTYSCSINSSVPVTDPNVPSNAILCADGNPVSNETIDEFETYWHGLEELSPTVGSIWSKLRMACDSWKIRAVHRFKGPYGGKTSWPILWVSNTADPVTPLKSARIMQGRFEGSGLVVQDSAGHCSLAQPTPCTLAIIRSYFQHGNLPEPGTLCIPPPSEFSLNSTDPESIFYEPSLEGSVVDAFDKDIGGVGCQTMHAAGRLQAWAANESRWFKGLGLRDLSAVIESAKALGVL